MNQDKFNIWLDKIVQMGQPAQAIIAYYFGIFQSTDGYQTYLTGSKEFDEEDTDWACNTDFVPNDKYFSLGQPDKNWEEILEQVKALIQNFKRTPSFENSFLAKVKVIATGFDNRDLVLI